MWLHPVSVKKNVQKYILPKLCLTPEIKSKYFRTGECVGIGQTTVVLVSAQGNCACMPYIVGKQYCCWLVFCNISLDYCVTKILKIGTPKIVKVTKWSSLVKAYHSLVANGSVGSEAHCILGTAYERQSTSLFCCCLILP